MKKLGNSLQSDDAASKIQMSISPFLKAVRRGFEGNPNQPVEDPLAWWRSESRLACLHPLLQHLWSIPASSASSERLFSYLGHLVNRAPQRSPVTLKRLALLRDYQKQPGFDFKELLKAVNEIKETPDDK